MGPPDKEVGKGQLRGLRLIMPEKVVDKFPVGQLQGPKLREDRDLKRRVFIGHHQNLTLPFLHSGLLLGTRLAQAAT